MARRGARARNDNQLAMAAGVVAGAILDAAWELYNLPLRDKPAGDTGLFQSDMIQFAISNSIALIGFTSANRMAPFGYGMVLSNVFTKVLAPGFGLPRYGLFDIKGGAIRPLGS